MSDKQKTALIAASVAVAGVTASSYLLRQIMRPILHARAATTFKQMLADADILVDRDIRIYDEDIFLDWVHRGMLAIGESYMAKKWDAIIPLDELLTRLLLLPADKRRKMFTAWNAKFIALGGKIFNYQSVSRAGIVGAHHYDLGNDFFKLWLDSNMQYSCAYWKGIEGKHDLDAAQRNKMHLIAKKLKLEPGMRVLEIGCGWGGLACFLAKEYGVHVTGITISNEQLKGAREWAKREGLTDLTSFEYCDYREMHGQFNRVVTIAMVEAVGYKNLGDFFTVIKRCLTDDGLALVHGIAANRSIEVPIQLWILKYIFPNGFLPSVAQLLLFAERKLIVEDVHNLGPDYDKTLMCWHDRFQDHLKKGHIDRPEVFCRMWDFYLLYCTAGFRARTIQLAQVVFSKNRLTRYDAAR
uniref:Cyclopropane-fatty-acyl-phospholipid synthase n=1 Tax=Peronospora matthiolae TaxID=2874970 RepID=A0AAV1UXW6_9STRA